MKDIFETETLNELLDLLIEMDDTETFDYYGVDITNLPTFGGDEPDSTSGVWSWDESYVLTGDGSVSDWTIEKRSEFFK